MSTARHRLLAIDEATATADCLGCQQRIDLYRRPSGGWECRPHRRARKRRYGRQRPPESRRAAKLAYLYGMTLADEQAMHAAQDGSCAICRRVTALVVDHDHSTGLVRALLCTTCNAALGLLNEDPERLRAAAAYLDRHRTVSA